MNWVERGEKWPMPILQQTSCLYSMTCIFTTSTRSKDGDPSHSPPPQNAMNVSEEDGLWESLEVDGKMPYGGMTYICYTDRPGRREQGTEKVWGRRSGRPWPENRPKRLTRTSWLKCKKQRETDFSLLQNVETGSKVRPIFHTVGTGVLFWG